MAVKEPHFEAGSHFLRPGALSRDLVAIASKQYHAIISGPQGQHGVHSSAKGHLALFFIVTSLGTPGSI